MTAYAIDSDVLYPRDEEHRYRLYARRGDELELLAAAPAGAVGSMILQLHADERERGRRLVDLGAIGLLDVVAREWILLPWQRPDRGATLGELPLPIGAVLEDWRGRRVRPIRGAYTWIVGDRGPFGYRLTALDTGHTRVTPIFRTADQLERWEIVDEEGAPNGRLA